MKTIHVVQHTSAEYLGLVEDHLEGRGIRFRYSRPFAAKGSLPQAETVGAGLVLLGGGPWGSAGERRVPTLAAEVDLARSCLERDVPVADLHADLPRIEARVVDEPVAQVLEDPLVGAPVVSRPAARVR